MVQRKGDWIETFTGKQFWALDPRPDDICIEDIAHALSNICRFNGHCKHFYSVAQHSINVANRLKEKGYDKDIQLYGLLHDASEAYLCDIPCPIKKYLSKYKKYETNLQNMIYEKFCCKIPDGKILTEIVLPTDDEVLYEEAQSLTNNLNQWAGEPVKIKIDVSFQQPKLIETMFKELYTELTLQQIFT
jgi:hypothetical protein